MQDTELYLEVNSDFSHACGVPAEKLTPDRRREIFIRLAQDEALDVAMAGGADAVARWVCAQYPELSHG